MAFLTAIMWIALALPGVCILFGMAEHLLEVFCHRGPAVPQPKGQLAGAHIVAQELLTVSGNAMFVGPPVSGRSALFEQLQFTAPACIVRVLLSEDVPGWQEAPFLGTFVPTESNESVEMELGEVLRDRPAGTFNLELPRQVLTEKHSAAEQLRRAVSEELLSPLTPGYSSQESTKLVVLVDMAEDVLTELATRSFGRYSRTVNCTAALFCDSMASVVPEFTINAPMLGAFRSPPAHGAIADQLLKLENGSVEALPEGQFWYNNSEKSATMRLAVRNPATVPADAAAATT